MSKIKEQLLNHNAYDENGNLYIVEENTITK